MVARPSRRGLLVGAAAAFGGLVVTGCGISQAQSPAVPTRTPPRAAARGDLTVLTAALAMERRTIATYAACVPLLSAADARWAQQCAVDELQQAGTVDRLIRLAGGNVPPLRGELAVGHPRDGAQALALLASLESEQVARYLAWIPRLSAGTMRAEVASILAADAQHVAVLRQARGVPALAPAFMAASAGAA